MPPIREPPEPLPIRTYVEDGARIVAILAVWAVIGAVFAFGVGNVGRPGSLFHSLGPAIGSLFFGAGGLNALLYVVYRAIDYYHA